MKLKELLSDINAKDEVVATYDKNDGTVYIYKSGSEDTSDSLIIYRLDTRYFSNGRKALLKHHRCFFFFFCLFPFFNFTCKYDIIGV